MGLVCRSWVPSTSSCRERVKSEDGRRNTSHLSLLALVSKVSVLSIGSLPVATSLTLFHISDVALFPVYPPVDLLPSLPLAWCVVRWSLQVSTTLRYS